MLTAFDFFQVPSSQKVIQAHSQDSPWVASPNGNHSFVRSPHRTFPDGCYLPFNGTTAYGNSVVCFVGLERMAPGPSYEWPFWISLSSSLFTRVSWLPPFEVIIRYKIRQKKHLQALRHSFFRFHTSYGWLTFWDWFYGTDIEFMKTDVHKDRHFRIHSSQSAKEIVPDKPKQK